MEPNLDTGLYEFYSDRCKACKNQQDILDNSDYTHYQSCITKINVDSNRELVPLYNIESLPTFLAIQHGGVEVDRITGNIGSEALHDWVIEYNYLIN